MNPTSSVESRIAALISAYADRAPIDVDPNALTRLVANRRARRPFTAPVLGDAGLAFVLLVAGLLIALVAGTVLVGADPFRRDPQEILKERAIVVPFTGLPPNGAAPSNPETGELVFSFYGRVRAIGLDLHRMSVYSDGRLIWKRNLDSTSDLRVFDGLEPTTAVIEQRLTPAGVELLRAMVMSGGLRKARLPDTDGGARANLPGVLWGGLTARQGERLVEMDWEDPELPARLADPGRWLPVGAWADRRVTGYVPSQYTICWPGAVGGAIDVPRIDELLREAPMGSGCGNPDGRSVSLEVARQIVSMLEADPRVDRDGDSLEFHVKASDGRIDILPVLPDGQGVCFCG